MRFAATLTMLLCFGWAHAEAAFDDDAALSGMKCTVKGPPTESTAQLGYLDHFVLDFKLKGSAEKSFVAAWFGRVAEGQLQVKFGREDERGKPYEIVDPSGKSIPPAHADNARAIPFHAESSNKSAGRADLSKGIGGARVPMIAASGTMRLYSSMHQRFSYSLVGLAAKHFNEFGARYSIEQLEALPVGVYRLRMPFTVALIEGDAVRAIQHGERWMALDLSAEKRAATLESFKGSGSPLITFEPADKK